MTILRNMNIISYFHKTELNEKQDHFFKLGNHTNGLHDKLLLTSILIMYKSYLFWLKQLWDFYFPHKYARIRKYIVKA